MRPIYVTKQLTALDRDGICQAQTTAGAGDLTINGALSSGGVATTDTQRIVGIYSTGNLTAVTFTVYGTNVSGISISESITGPNNTTVSSVLNYATVTRIAVSAAVGTNVEVGTTGVGATLPIPMDQYISPFNASVMVEIASGATVNVTVQYTDDDVFSLSNVQSATGLNWSNHPTLASITATSDSYFSYNVSAIRLLVNSGTDAATMVVRQAGIGGT